MGTSVVDGSLKGLRRIPLAYESKNSEKSALALIYTLCPDWEHSEGPVEIIRFKDGITNTLLMVIKKTPGKSDEDVEQDAVLLRAYGNDTEILIDREREAESHAMFADRGLAPALLARFDNGLLYRYISGNVCTPKDFVTEAIWRPIARRLAEWHSVPVPETYYATTTHSGSNGVNGSHIDGQVNGTAKRKGHPNPNVWTTMQRWVEALPTSTPALASRKSQLQTELARTEKELGDSVDATGEDMIFGHCDLLSANVIILPEMANAQSKAGEKDVRFIDYEYATACPAAFDIANHFSEWGGYDCDYTMLPSRSVRRAFIDEYVRNLTWTASDSSKETDTVVNALASQIDDFRGIPGLYWGIWSLIQSTISQIDFDYTSYAEVRLGEYFGWRAEADGTGKQSHHEPTLREGVWASDR